MQPTFAAFNFKSSSNDQDGSSPSTLEENIDACRFPTRVDPPKTNGSASILMAYPVRLAWFR